jgi:aspartate racemase
MREKVVGVIGGMGPEATVDFLRRLIAAVPARDDADHIRVLIDNNPKIPSRLAALVEKTGEDPAPVLCEMARGLEKQGADFLVMPCNTAHYFLPRIAQAVNIPLLDVVTLSIAKLAALSPKPKKVGILATPAVRLVGLYEARLRDTGMDAAFPDAANEAKLLDVIRAVKANAITEQHHLDYADAARSQANVDALLIACTELSVLGAPRGISKPAIDALDVLVSATVAEARG